MKKEQGPDKTGTPLSDAQERYDRIYLHNSILSDEVLVQVLCNGQINTSEINAALAVDEQFVAPDEEPNWRKVWHGFLRDASEFEPAFRGLETEFAERKFEDPGTVMHVLGMRLWGVELGELDKTKEAIIDEGKAYVDDLRRTGRLRRGLLGRGFHDASHGLAYHSAGTPAFQTLYHYYLDQAELAYQDTWPRLAESLLVDMSGDAEAFYTRVCWSGGPQPDCAGDAILSKIAPKAFVDKLIVGSPQAQRTILAALKARYETGQLANSLAAECAWLVEMEEELRNRLPSLPRIRQYSLSSEASRLLEPALRQARATIQSAASVKPLG